VGEDRRARVSDHLLQRLRCVQDDLLRPRDGEVQPGTALTVKLICRELLLAGDEHVSWGVEDEHEVRLWGETP
jgi:hypothetical protein